MEEVEDEPLFADRVAGIDIGKKEIMVTIRVPSDTGSRRRQQETREFRATRKTSQELKCQAATGDRPRSSRCPQAVASS